MFTNEMKLAITHLIRLSVLTHVCAMFDIDYYYYYYVCILKYVNEYGYFVLMIDIVTNRGISIVTFP